MRQLVAHFKWRGVVGCSITKKSCELLGVDASSFETMESDAGKLLAKALHGKASFVHTMVHTTAAGYSDLVWGQSAQEELWSGQVVLVVTLGQNLGAVVFKDGKRVRNAEWCQRMQPEPEGPEESEMVEAEGCPPQVLGLSGLLELSQLNPKNALWMQWADVVDSMLRDLLQSVPTLDQLLILPTGRSQLFLDDLRPLFFYFKLVVSKQTTLQAASAGPGLGRPSMPRSGRAATCASSPKPKAPWCGEPQPARCWNWRCLGPTSTEACSSRLRKDRLRNWCQLKHITK